MTTAENKIGEPHDQILCRSSVVGIMLRSISVILSFIFLLIIASTFKCANNRQKRSLVQKYAKLWPQARIPYVLDTRQFSEIDLKIIQKAMQTLEEETCITFRYLGNTSSTIKDSHINIIGQTHRTCYSEIGKSSNPGQKLIIGPLCRSFGQILHELCHAVGMMHELMRPDRDQYVKLHKKNIISELKSEFEQLSPTVSSHYEQPFDFQSIMLYDPFTFSANGFPVWEPKVELFNIPLLPLSEKDLSYQDAAAINKLYKCQDRCKNPPKCRPSEYLNKSCRCEKAYLYAHRRCRNDPKESKYCMTVVNDNKCYDQAQFAVPFCRRSCGRCFRNGNYGNAEAPVKRCTDLEQKLCPTYVKEGFCYFDAWTKINCRKSCNLCPPPQVARRQIQSRDARFYLEAFNAGKCFNRFDELQCQVFAEQGQCTTNPTFMNSQCSRACGICKPGSGDDELSYLDKHKPPPCKNYIDDARCDALAREGKCNQTTLKQCLASCGKCGPTNLITASTTKTPTSIAQPSSSSSHNHQPSTTSTTTSAPVECKDKSTSCDWLVEKGRCKTQLKSMSHLCPLSCQLCKPPCKDIDSPTVCDDIMRRGYCQRSDYYRQRCASTCGQCNVTTDLSNNTSVKATREATEKAKKKSSKSKDKKNTGKRSKKKGSKDKKKSKTKRNKKSKSRSKDKVKKTDKHRSKKKKTDETDSNFKSETPTKLRATKTVAGHTVRKKSAMIKEESECSNIEVTKTCLSWKLVGYCAYPQVQKICKKTCDMCSVK